MNASLDLFPDHWPIESDWSELLTPEFQQPYFRDLTNFVLQERNDAEIFPPATQVFRAFELTTFSNLKVVILGQDPYHGPGQAHGLSFSVAENIKLPPSLRNIFRELVDDLSCPEPAHGNLESWARQGVLLLNTVLTVRSGQANSHQKKGWEKFTDAVFQLIGKRDQPTAFILWGKPAAKKIKWIDTTNHLVIESAHPSPLSARRGFFGSQPFSKVNEFFAAQNLPTVDWNLAEADC